MESMFIDLKNDFAVLSSELNSYKLFKFRTKIVWFNAIGFLVLHLIGIYGLYVGLLKFFTLQIATTVWSILLGFLSGQGITMGAHRLWTHRAFKATTPVEVALIVFHTLAGENCLYVWARDHRQHHMYTDTDADPHNASRGFFFSHIGWLMMKKHPDIFKMGKTIDMSDLEANKIVMFQKKYYKTLYFLLTIVIPVGVPIYFWNENFVDAFLITFFARTVVTLNITWTVNSIAHIFGTRPFDRTILPVESFFVSFITLGEGWHNYHHSFPWDYKAGEFGAGYNGTRYFIELLNKYRWVYDLRTTNPKMVNARALKRGDGSFVVTSTQEKSDDSEELPQMRLLNHGR